jgi:hypothetical protein
MLDTFVQHWPKSVRIIAYLDQDMPGPIPAAVEVRPFPAWFAPWRARHMDTPDAHGRDRSRNRAQREYDFRRDCLRFSFKVGALTEKVEGDIVIWMDADIMTFRPIDEKWLKDVAFPKNTWMSWIDRRNIYPECGFMVFDFTKDDTKFFMESLGNMYWSDRVFSLAQTHDSYVIQQVVDLGNFPKPMSLNQPRWFDKHHPFPLIPLGQRLDHLKGNRKTMDRSPERIR